MNSDLVRPAGLQAEFRQAELTETFHDLPMGTSFPTFSGPDRHFLAVFRVPPNHRLDLTFIRNLAQDNTQVSPLGGMRLELGG